MKLLVRTAIQLAGTIAGNGGNDTIAGGSGNDLLIGAADTNAAGNILTPVARANGSDTYLFRRGDGNDSIADFDPSANTDTLKLMGINPGEVTASIANSRWDAAAATTVADIVLDLGQGESVTIRQALAASGTGLGRIERVEFEDGTVWRNKSRRWWDGGRPCATSPNCANDEWRTAACF